MVQTKITPMKTICAPINYHQYLRPICALFCILLNIICWFPPVLAAKGGEDQLSATWAGFDQTALTKSWSGYVPLQYKKFAGLAAFETDTDKSGRGYRWEGPPAEYPDWRGIKWDTLYFVGYQFVAIGIIYMLPESISGWTDEDKDDYSFSKWVNNVRNPIWDEDEWYVNYILHPYWGAAYYIRARERGFGRMHSFWYSFLLSTLYEYGAEALFEPVSYQDLVVTPVAGALLGEYLFSPLREWVRAKSDQLDWSDKTLLFFTDPLGVVSEGTSRLLGVNTAVNFQPLVMGSLPLSSGLPDASEIALPARTISKPVWGLHIKIIW